MRYRLPLYLATVLGLAGCMGTEVTQSTKTPDAPGSGPQLTSAVPNPYCTAKTTSEINDEIHNLFVKNSWPDENSALGKFKAIQDSLDAGNVTGAQDATENLVNFITLKFSQLTAAQQAAAQSDYDSLISDLWCFVGISGIVFDLNPGDPAKAFDIPGVGGVLFPPDAVPVGTRVGLTDLSAGPCPVLTVLDCFRGYMDISLYPPNPLSGLATVVLCDLDGVAGPKAVGHQASFGFELLPVVPVPDELANTCATSSSQANPTGWFGDLVQRAADLFLPQKLHASSYMVLLATGGVSGTFSPTALIGTDLSGSDGTGWSTGTFTPPAASPNSSPSLNPPLPAGLIEGTVGTTQTTGLPPVTVSTFGGDANGANPVPGVAVVFTIGPAQSYDPDSDAQICDDQGQVQTSVTVLTNSSGQATLPCLKFGTKAGFANLSARFDPTSLPFPGAYQVTVTTSDANGGSGTSLNWLVESDPGPASVIQTYIGGAAAPTYSYGTGLTPFTTVSPAPQVLVTDTYGNPIAGQTVYWNATSVNGGVLTVGSTGTPTNSAGTAEVSSWLVGDGVNLATAGIYDANTIPPAGYQDALFTASTPTGISVFACSATPGSKNDLGPMSIDAPNGSIKSVTIQMSITGTSASISNYGATLVAHLDGLSGTELGRTSGTVQLPGDNGNPSLVTFVFPSYIARQTGNHTIWFDLSVVTPPQRKPQVWYANQKFKSNDPCYDARLYAPGSTTTFVNGLWINVTN